jgi:rsbT co-antagonist protein RsbR
MAELKGSYHPTLMREMGFSEQSIERRQRYVALDSNDIKRILTLRTVVTEHAEGLTNIFFEYLSDFPEAQSLLGNRDLMEKARRLKRTHLIAMVEGNYGMEYVEQRLELGLIYSKGGLEARVFLGAFHNLLKNVGLVIMKQHDRAWMDSFENFMSLKKVAFLDIGIITDVLVYERERTIRQQQEAIRELSTPVLQIRERMLLLPVIGVIDTLRARLLTEGLLRAIRENRAKVVVIDITGVATIDSKVANHLIQTVVAAQLMGASVIITGLSPDVAQSLVALGIDLTKLNTVGDLQGGMEEAEIRLGYRMVRHSQADPMARTQNLPL